MVAFTSLKPERVFQAVEQMYTAVAREPQREFHFPTARAAALAVGYPEAALRALPAAALESFAGVGYPYRAEVVRPGDTVLDIGSGSGTDALIASRLVGAAGRVYALDMTAAMREKLAGIVAAAGIGNVEVVAGNAQEIPLPDRSVDVVTSNGVLNLVPDKARAFVEIARVLKPGGRVQIADIALAEPVADKYRRDPAMWAECVVGAVPEDRYLALLREAGLDEPEVLGHLDYFALSRSEETRTVAGLFGARALVLRARKPLAARTSAPAAAASARASLNRQVAAVAGAAVAYTLCTGLAAVASAATAASALVWVGHGTFYTLFIATVAGSLWLHYRSARDQAYLLPFQVALAFGVSGVVVFALLLAGRVLPLWWYPYAALAGMIGASLWSFWKKQSESCVDEMVRAAQQRRS
jgi:SAM-dependent methyltransferase